MHVPDVTAPGIFRHALRFVNTDPSAPAGKYVATYETTWEDVSKAMPAHREASVKLRERRDRGMPYIQVVRSGVFKRLGGEFCAASRPARRPHEQPALAAGAAERHAPWGHGRGARRCWRVGHGKSGLFSLYSSQGAYGELSTGALPGQVLRGPLYDGNR